MGLGSTRGPLQLPQRTVVQRWDDLLRERGTSGRRLVLEAVHGTLVSPACEQAVREPTLPY
jgi:hypothetical protein